MSTQLCEPTLRQPSASLAHVDAEVRSQVWNLLSAMYPLNGALERRHDQRYAYPRLVQLSPVEPDGQTPTGSPLVVVGRSISEQGMGFFHPQPLANRLVIASLERCDGGWLSFLVDIHRCRFTRHGWYESGGRFLRAVTPPLGNKSDGGD